MGGCLSGNTVADVGSDSSTSLDQDTPEARAASLKQMKHMWEVMKNSASQYQSEQRSYSGLVGGDGARYAEAWASGILMGDCY